MDLFKGGYVCEAKGGGGHFSFCCQLFLIYVRPTQLDFTLPWIYKLLACCRQTKYLCQMFSTIFCSPLTAYTIAGQCGNTVRLISFFFTTRRILKNKRVICCHKSSKIFYLELREGAFSFPRGSNFLHYFTCLGEQTCLSTPQISTEILK